MDDFFHLAPPRRHRRTTQTKLMDVLHAQDIDETARLLVSLNAQLPADCTVLIQDLSELDGAESWQAPWSPTRLTEALTTLRMCPELETFRSRTGAHWFTIHASTNPDLTDVDAVGEVLAEARTLQREDLALEANVLADLDDLATVRGTAVIPAYRAAIAQQLEFWQTRSTRLGTQSGELHAFRSRSHPRGADHRRNVALAALAN